MKSANEEYPSRVQESESYAYNFQKTMEAPRKRSLLLKESRQQNGLYGDFPTGKQKDRITVPMNLKNKYNRFNLKQVREEIRKNTNEFIRSSKVIGRTNPISPATGEDYNSDYPVKDYSVFKVTFDKDSTTVTDMGNSGFSFTEAVGTSNPQMNRSVSYSGRGVGLMNKRETIRSVDNLLPIINQYRRSMNSPMSTHARDIQFDDIIIA